MGDATIEFLGRQDAQVKLQGYRVELGEIEHCARSHPEVDECCVVVRDLRANGRAAPEQRRGVEHRFLVAYIVPRSGMQPSEPELRAHLREKLPEYMVPARITTLDRLPLSPNGKVDRSALPEVSAELPGASPGALGLAEEATPTEQAVTALWANILGLSVEQVQPHTNFFDLGGNSLLLIAVSRALKDQLQRTVPLAQLFQNTTVHALAAHLDEQASESESESSTAERDRRVAALERQRQLRTRGRERRDDP
jgi:acyl carrier protein